MRLKVLSVFGFLLFLFASKSSNIDHKGLV